ncbi:hypothetical protein MML48_5g00001507 [Holotrichia oblita]|uniref:Uncharacterized protein n=1 Tax=Holotrichia oblita TaxID=644536 RepID=A0ACB9T5W4_HOLOL|nr:hypothetical protein MML48_5g00001507 [Holotrichia oblita]
MSRARSYAAYATSNPPAPQLPTPTACYYYDDMEGYVGDYSESEGLSDGGTHVVTTQPPPPDVTEIYRRKTVSPTTIPPTAMPPPPPTTPMDYHAVYAPQEYYYETGTPQAAPASRRATLAYRKRIPLERPARYYSPVESGELYDTMGFRSTHQMVPNVTRNLPPRVPSTSAVRQTSVRRHPITVRTPRFYRRPGSTTLYKRPSALCLPVACQPDPAVYKRSKRPSNDQIYPTEYVYQQPPAPPVTKVGYPTERIRSSQYKPPQEPPGNEYTDLNVTKSKLDAALQRYEQIFEKNGTDAEQRYPDAKIAQMLKPKVPQTIKDKQQEQGKLNTKQQQEKHVDEKQKVKSRKSPKIDWSKARILEVEGAESDALEKILLADLKANGMVESDDLVENKSERKKSPTRNEKKPEKMAQNLEPNIPEISLKDLPKSFNYQEIQNVVVKTKQHQQNQQNQKQAELKQQFHNNNPSDHIPPSKKCSKMNLAQEQLLQMSDNVYSRPTSAQGSHLSSKRQPSNENLDKSSDCKSVRAGVVPRVLVDDALELHRTKSYVVNLIDHALSNHFGTNLCEKYSTKDNPIDPRVAMELLKKHSACKVNKDMCLEIAQALADTFNNSTTSCSTMTQCEAKAETSPCTCSKAAEEPLYVKQLKQLRWGHLKHIQREVRRLEDLERFLDSCTSNTFS